MEVCGSKMKIALFYFLLSTLGWSTSVVWHTVCNSPGAKVVLSIHDTMGEGLKGIAKPISHLDRCRRVDFLWETTSWAPPLAKFIGFTTRSFPI